MTEKDEEAKKLFLKEFPYAERFLKQSCTYWEVIEKLLKPTSLKDGQEVNSEIKEK